MNKQTYLNYVKLQSEVSSFCLDFINKILDEEQQILERNKKYIYANIYNWGENPQCCEAIKFHLINYANDKNSQEGYKLVRYIKAKDFQIDKVEENGLLMKFVYSKYWTFTHQIFIPFNISEKEYIKYIVQYFKPLYSAIDYIMLEDRKTKQQQQEEYNYLRQPKKDGIYNYVWQDCTYCKGIGTVQIGTGKFKHQGHYDREGEYIETEVFKTEACPSCFSFKGFLLFSKDGNLNQRCTPCSISTFKQYHTNFHSLLENIIL